MWLLSSLFCFPLPSLLTQVAFNDDCYAGVQFSCLTLTVAVGTTYAIQIDGYAASYGTSYSPRFRTQHQWSGSETPLRLAAVNVHTFHRAVCAPRAGAVTLTVDVAPSVTPSPSLNASPSPTPSAAPLTPVNDMFVKYVTCDYPS